MNEEKGTLEFLEVRTRDGATSQLLLARAPAPPPGQAPAGEPPLVCVIPALGMEAGYYDRFAKELASRGVHVAVIELRGMGSSSVRASRQVDFGYGTHLVEDIPAALAVARGALPGAPLYLLGHSLGGQLATAFAGLHPEAAIEGMILVASGTPYFRTWPFPASLVLRIIAHTFLAIARAVGHFPGKRIGFATREARTVMRDWATLVHEGRFDLVGWDGPDIEAAIATLSLPVLAITLENDIFVPAHVTEHMLAKMPGARVERWHWDPEREGLPPTHHVRWPRRADPIVDRVEAWLRLGPSGHQSRTSRG